MSTGVIGWERLRHGGLLLDAPRLKRIGEFEPEPLSPFLDRELRRQAVSIIDGSGDVSAFVTFVLKDVCGFSESAGHWQRGSNVSTEWGRVAITRETIKPRQLWQGSKGGVLPVFIDSEKRIGVGRGKRATSQVLQWLRAGPEKLALITNGRQWRLIFAGLDFDAWCEWDLDLWFEEGELSPQVVALRTLFSPSLWIPTEKDERAPLLQAIQDSRKGQAELSAVLGERVREAVELVVQGHGEVLKERCSDVAPAEIYRAAVRMVMRLVVVLFAESRELLPRDNALYHGSYGVTGLLEELEKIAARGGNRLARSWNAWPRVLSLFRLVHQGSHHPDLTITAYGGELFAPGDPVSNEGLSRALAVFESACYERELMSDRDVHRALALITRTRIKLRQGRSSTWVPAPVDFSDLSSEYIGILYEGLLDFELRTVPAGDPVIFLAVGNQPALPLSRLEAMDDKALANLLEKMKDTSSSDDEAGEAAEDAEEENIELDSSQEGEGAEGDEEEEPEDPTIAEEPDDERHTTRTRAEVWARRAVAAGNLVRRPRGQITPEKRLAFEESVGRKARQLVTRVILPGEWYLVRWGGTRKGGGTFYTRPGLAVPTVQRTLRPLAYTAPLDTNSSVNRDAPASEWAPKLPEEILALKVCDPACGSGSFPVAALRFLTDALYSSLHSHNRLTGDWRRPLDELLGLAPEGVLEENLKLQRLPCAPEEGEFEHQTKAVLRRYVVERCIYGVDLDPLAVELCRLALWIETMDRTLPFSFLDHKVKCGNSLIGAWFDQFQHYPVMAWKNREGGDKNHGNGVHFEKEVRTNAIKSFVKDKLIPDLKHLLQGRTLFNTVDLLERARAVHDGALKTLSRLHELPVQDSAERARIYREELLGSAAYKSLKSAMDLWCACWFWPAEDLDEAPIPTTFNEPSEQTRNVAKLLAIGKRFFHWELEFPDVFRTKDSGFDAMLGNPPWEVAKPNSKEFFSNIDPLYRSYGKQEALRYQMEYFNSEEIELTWLDYKADFRARSNFIDYAAGAYGDPVYGETSSDKFSIARGKDNEKLHDKWRQARVNTGGFSDVQHPFRHQGSADINLYKLFLEQSHALLQNHGRVGFIVPSGLYSDQGTRGLRSLFLDRCVWEWLFGIENREKVFDIDSRFKFNPVIIQKGGKTKAIRAAFMRRKLEEWEVAEAFVQPYTREQVERLSPTLLCLVEVTSLHQLRLLETVYHRMPQFSQQLTSGWSIDYGREFHMTDDAKSFPPLSKWEAQSYEPGPFGAYWSNQEGTRAVPLYEGRMIRAFDYSAQRWISGKGRQAVWSDVPMAEKTIGPQYLMAEEVALGSAKGKKGPKLGIVKVSSATNSRSLKCALIPKYPCGESVYTLQISPNQVWRLLFLETVFCSYVFDFLLRVRFGGVNISAYLLGECAIPSVPIPRQVTNRSLVGIAAKLSFVSPVFSPLALSLAGELNGLIAVAPGSSAVALTGAERLRLRCVVDALVGVVYELTSDDFATVLSECDLPTSALASQGIATNLDPKGFWRVDKDKDPELRHTVLTLVAFHDLQEKITACGGEREKGIEAFMNQNDGEGWMLPETLRLADYGLGHDERAKEHQPVANRLGPRFYDWQLTQSAAESWRECHRHARNLLGESGYQTLLTDIENQKLGSNHALATPVYTSSSGGEDPQNNLFE
jgi:hypothetical protein